MRVAFPFVPDVLPPFDTAAANNRAMNAAPTLIQMYVGMGVQKLCREVRQRLSDFPCLSDVHARINQQKEGLLTLGPLQPGQGASLSSALAHRLQSRPQGAIILAVNIPVSPFMGHPS